MLRLPWTAAVESRGGRSSAARALSSTPPLEAPAPAAALPWRWHGRLGCVTSCRRTGSGTQRRWLIGETSNNLKWQQIYFGRWRLEKVPAPRRERWSEVLRSHFVCPNTVSGLKLLPVHWNLLFTHLCAMILTPGQGWRFFSPTVNSRSAIASCPGDCSARTCGWGWGVPGQWCGDSHSSVLFPNLTNWHCR